MVSKPFADPFNPFANRQDLPACYAWLREHAPVYDSGHGIMLFRYRDVARLQSDARHFSRGGSDDALSLFGDTSLRKIMADTLFQIDPPLHTEQRQLVQPAFAAKAVEALRPATRQLCNEALDAFERSGKETFDVLADYADHVPLLVICELLGIPPQDHKIFRQKTKRFTPAVDLVAQPDLPGVKEGAMDAAGWLSGYIHAQITAARTRRGEKPTIITHLLEAGLDDAQIGVMAVMLLIAGHENVVNSMGILVYLSGLYPEAFAKASASGQGTLPRSVLYEAWRLLSPTQLAIRRVAPGQKVDLDGVQYAEGTQMIGFIGSANRDPRIFNDPEVFDPERPRSHQALSFGKGAFYCLGEPLTILEIQEMYAALRARLAVFEFVPNRPDRTFQPDWTLTTLFYGLQHVPLFWKRHSRSC